MVKQIVSQEACDGNDKGGNKDKRPLWLIWWSAVSLLRPAFSRESTFMWFAVILAGFIARPDMLGVSSFMRALNLQDCCYYALLGNFHSTAISLDRLTALWTQAVLGLFPNPVRVNGRLLLVADGTKAPKRGKRMPGVKRLHQQSECNNKAEWITGHSLQGVCLLVNAACSVFAVPLALYIHEGVRFTPRDKRTLMDKLIILIEKLALRQHPFYLVADAYYANGKIIKGLHQRGNYLISRVKSNTVANQLPVQEGPRRRGRPKIYGAPIKLASFLENPKSMEKALSPVYGEKDVIIRYRVEDLLWRPAGCLVRFVAVVHPSRGSFVLISTDTSLCAVDIIRAYGLRFKIELSFKQAVHCIGSLAYHFWMRAMKPLKRNSGDQYLHREPRSYRDAVKRKMHAYDTFLQAAIIAQGLLQYLSASFPVLVWNSFGSWLRTIRPGLAPSERVVAIALRQRLPEFLLHFADEHVFAKFIAERQDFDRMETFGMAA
jgi:DDE superfamily endonuclease